MGIRIKQNDSTDCGAACLVSIGNHFGLRLPIAKIRQMAGTDQRGTNLLGLISAAEQLGFAAKGVRTKMDDLGEVPLPAIAHIIVGQKFHHFVVVYRICRKYVRIMDPSTGKMRNVQKKEWADVWTGIFLLVAPSADFKRGNHTVSVYRRFWSLLRPHRSVLLHALIGAVLYTILGLSVSIYIQKITDYVLIDGNRNLLNLLSVVMVGLLLMQLLIGYTKSIFIVKTGQKIDAQLILGYFGHLMRLPQQFFDTMRVGEMLSRIGDAVKIRVFINEAAIHLFVNLFIVIFSFALMYTYYWKLALMMSLIIPLYLTIYLITNYLNKRRERMLMERAAELESQFVTSLTAIRTVKQFGLQRFTQWKTEGKFINLLEATYYSAVNGVFSATSADFVNRVFTIALLWLGSLFVIDRLITPGELLSFYAIIGYFTGPASALINMNKTIQNAIIAADRLFEIMDLEPERSEGIVLKPDMMGDIQFRAVRFRYGSRKEVFHQLDLTLRQGRCTAIVGESGSGKSTIASLLQNLYDLNGGQILIGSYDLAYVCNHNLRQLVSVVPQRLDLFAGNVVDNIAIGESEPDLRKIVDICRRLGLMSFIEGLPNGFDTDIGENGNQLSGGQRQRLAIARALYRSPQILILDEATSALDSTSEAYVQKEVRRLQLEGMTIIIITHRLNTIVHADHIVVLEKGKVCEQGCHPVLISKKGKYFNLWEKQFSS